MRAALDLLFTIEKEAGCERGRFETELNSHGYTTLAEGKILRVFHKRALLREYTRTSTSLYWTASTRSTPSEKPVLASERYQRQRR